MKSFYGLTIKRTPTTRDAIFAKFFRYPSVRLLSLLVLTIIFFTHCNHSHDFGTTARAVYYWRTVFSLSDDDVKQLDRLQIQQMYVRIFDIDMGAKAEPAPKAPIRLRSDLPNDMSYTPVVYITVPVLRWMNKNPDAATTLADKILRAIDDWHKASGWPDFQEVQIDADWTTQTEKVYFALLDQIRHRLHQNNQTVSCTLRLHQLHPDAKKPPVDRQLLMVYNLRRLDEKSPKTILDTDLAIRYMQGRLIHYQANLDIALPVYTWASHFHGNRFIGLIDEMTYHDLVSLPVSKTDNSFYRMKKRSRFKSSVFDEGDTIRFENPTNDSVKMAKWLRLTLKGRPDPKRRLILFHFDDRFFNKANEDAIDSIYRAL